jgi:hypothetical protein
VAVTSLVAARDGDVGAATRLGALWGAGHAATLLAVGLPLVVVGAELPGWLEQGAERLIGLAIVLLAARVLWRWARRSHRTSERAPLEALGIGMLHGLAGSGAVALLLVAAIDDATAAAAALAVFGAAAAISMTAATAAFSWALTRPALAPVWRVALMPALGLLGVAFGAWYAW